MAEQTSHAIILWDGYCYVHENITADHLISLKVKHPQAQIIVHPECGIQVRGMADFIGGTAQMSRHVANSPQKEFIVGTEINFAYRLRKDNPDKKFYPVNTRCEGMNEITLEKLETALERMEYKVHIPETIGKEAKVALEKMLRVAV